MLHADMDGDGVVGYEDYMIWVRNYYAINDPAGDVTGDGAITSTDFNLVKNCAIHGASPQYCQTASYSKSVYYSHNDHLGTPHLLTNEAGVAVCIKGVGDK